MLCPFCKSEVPDDAKKCKICGEWIDPAFRTKNENKDGFFSALSESFFNLVWFLFVAAIITIAVLLYIQAHENGLLG